MAGSTSSPIFITVAIGRRLGHFHTLLPPLTLHSIFLTVSSIHPAIRHTSTTFTVPSPDVTSSWTYVNVIIICLPEHSIATTTTASTGCHNLPGDRNCMCAFQIRQCGLVSVWRATHGVLGVCFMCLVSTIFEPTR